MNNMVLEVLKEVRIGLLITELNMRGNKRIRRGLEEDDSEPRKGFQAGVYFLYLGAITQFIREREREREKFRIGKKRKNVCMKNE